MHLVGVLGAWFSVSVIVAIGWARFHAAMGARPAPSDPTHEGDVSTPQLGPAGAFAVRVGHRPPPDKRPMPGGAV